MLFNMRRNNFLNNIYSYFIFINKIYIISKIVAGGK